MKLTHFLPLILAFATTRAATLNVTTNADAGVGSLRTQIAAAASGDSIAFSAAGTITLTTGEIVITGKDLAIVGPGAGSLAITTGSTKRALKIINANTTISGLTFQNCRGLPGDVDTGGAIAVDNFTAGGGAKVTTIADCTFLNNESGWGGAVDIFHGGLDMANCTFSANTCTGLAFGTKGGGGALSLGVTVASTITNCTFMGNVDASGAAGAIRGNFTGSYRTLANLKNCLLVNNQAPGSALKNFAGNPPVRSLRPTLRSAET